MIMRAEEANELTTKQIDSASGINDVISDLNDEIERCARNGKYCLITSYSYNNITKLKLKKLKKYYKDLGYSVSTGCENLGFISLLISWEKPNYAKFYCFLIFCMIIGVILGRYF